MGANMFKWKSLWLGLFLVFSASAVYGQYGESGYGRYEITPFVGYRFGGTIDLSQSGNPNIDYIKINNDVNFGVIGDITFWSNFQGEFMWNRERTSLTGHDPATNSLLYLTSMNFDMYQWSVVYNFLSPDRKLRPFAVAGLGFSHYGAAPVDGESVLGFSNRFAYNVGGGVKYSFSPHWGVRAEVRFSPSHATSGVATYCDPFFGCYPATVANKANQGQLNVGVIYRFGRSY
jgi:opacity protein-like surface antigen